MIWSVTRLTLRECFRRPFPYVLAGTLIAAVLASRLFLAFTFGQDRAESLNLVISAAFLGGFAITAFLGTGLIRRDLERKTLGWMLSMPLGPAEYVAGRLAGLLLASFATAGLVALGSSPILTLWTHDLGLLDVLAAAARTVSPVLVLGGAALALSTIASRLAAPMLLLAIFLLGSFGGGIALPDFALFGLDANATAPGPLTLLYGLVFCSIFALLAYIVLAIRAPANSQD
jgi:ABC-type transport system involved in multi-copper enzyme maturation permease subunit